jgi:hypothetical protein
MAIIRNFSLDLSDLPATGQTRSFSINGDVGSEFILEVKDNSTGYYYNFTTQTFGSAKSTLENVLTGNSYQGSIVFPNTVTTDVVNGAVSAGVKVVMDNAVANKMAVGDRVTGNNTLNSSAITVAALNPDGDNANEFSLSSAVAIADDEILSFSGDDQYDIYLQAKPGTEHAPYNEVRFADGTIDLNSSTGSNSLLMQKVIYQYADTNLILRAYNPTGAFIFGSKTDASLNFSRGGNTGKIPFSFSCSSASGASFQIQRQPSPNDILSFLLPVVGSDPEKLPGENEYPEERAAFTGDDVNGAVTSGQVVRMDNTDLSAVIEVGDKITTPTTTDTVDGDVTSGVKVVMDNNVATNMAVGDRISVDSPAVLAKTFEDTVITVAALNPDGDNVKEFSMSRSVAIGDGATLRFSSQINRELTTVTVVETSGTATDFTMSQAVQLRDNAPLTFSPRKNYQWPLDNISKVTPGMIVVPSTNITTGTKVSEYRDTITLFADTQNERVITKNRAPALNTKNQKPTVTKGVVTTQPGSVVFNKQQVLAFAGNTLKLGGYGESQILNVHGFDVRFTDLAINLAPVTTTTTAASFDNTSVVVAARDGILNGTSTVSGIGINPSSIPTVSSGANATGAGTIVLDTAQTLENGVTLTFAEAGKTAIVTGNIEVLNAGPESAVLYFDMEKLLTSA